MGKSIADAVLDAALAYVADNGNKLYLCSAEPTTFTEASATYALADATLATGIGGGVYTKANGDTSGRKLTVAAQSAVPVDASGTATHLAICKSGTSALLFVTTCTSQAVTSGNTVDIAAFDLELRDPS